MYAFQRSSCPSFFHPSTNRRMYRLLNRGLIGDPWGVPFPSSRLRVLRCLFPRSSVSSTGASSHILIRCSIAPLTILRATDLRRSACGSPLFGSKLLTAISDTQGRHQEARDSALLPRHI